MVSIIPWGINACHCIINNLVTPFEAAEHYLLTQTDLDQITVLNYLFSHGLTFTDPHMVIYTRHLLYIWSKIVCVLQQRSLDLHFARFKS